MRALVGALLLAAGCAAPGFRRTPETVDLLALLNPAEDAVNGDWKLAGGTLTASTVKFGRIQIPYHPPEEYDVRLVATRKDGLDSIVLGLVGGGRQFAVVIDAFPTKTFSGIDRINDKAFPDNETRVPGRIVTTGKAIELICLVRKDRVAVELDGKPIIDWKADFARVSLFDEWQIPDRKALFLGAWTAPWVITACELTPVTGSGRRLR